MSSTVMASAPVEHMVQGRRQIPEQRIRGTLRAWHNRGSAECFWGVRGKSLGERFRLRTSWELAGKERESHEYQVKGQRVERPVVPKRRRMAGAGGWKTGVWGAASCRSACAVARSSDVSSEQREVSRGLLAQK